MAQPEKQRSTSIHRKVQISNASKKRKTAKRPGEVKVADEPEAAKVNVADKPEAMKVNVADKPEAVKVDVKCPQPVIVKFRTEPIPESELIQEKIAEVVAPEPKPVVEIPKKIDDARKRASKRMAPQEKPVRPNAKQIKEQEIKKAISAANVKTYTSKKQRRGRKYAPVHFGFHRVVLALACATAAVFAIVYLVDANSPDISLKVAAIQTGIDAVYPKYTPRGYALSDITSENGKVTLNFKNAETSAAYSLVEENYTADASRFLKDFVEPNFGNNYTKIDEQGVSVYIDSNKAVWLTDGILYQLSINSGSLTRKQIVTIATTR